MDTVTLGSVSWKCGSVAVGHFLPERDANMRAHWQAMRRLTLSDFISFDKSVNVSITSHEA